MNKGEQLPLSTIYVVGGLPRTGKTTVCERLSHDIRIGAMETDHVRRLFCPTPTSKIGTHSGADIPTVTRKMRPRLESLIDSLVTSGTSFALNGECIDPYMVSESPYRNHIASCFMGLNDPDAAFDRIRTIADPRDWAMQQTDEALRRILEKYAQRSRALGELCMSLELPYIDASTDFAHAQEEAYSALLGDHPHTTIA